ncbi:BlaI/MecI/CopY family transcriptional regulator [Actinokineospora xionganensis]|uniref:BlaI/MecI/CopY family transcriptional regulator n=1 Tax=Actinokineospora xionganensis TaxID=2684470 RepID=A0ABR7L0P4_9PSEU|nr:BlaI/MecI/CopY family transcriptional regulator [Actinokineospora xionganensis]MBC6445971.1 BlaI/MecI/CopY family transcriptional regulator [Actinokineospora xionganensis]
MRDIGGELEAAIMNCLWAATSPLSVRELREQLATNRRSAYNTVQTVVENLCRKDLVTRERDGRAFRYQATMSRAEHSAALMATALAGGDDTDAVFLRFVDRISSDDVDALRKALRKAKRAKH